MPALLRNWRRLAASLKATLMKEKETNAPVCETPAPGNKVTTSKTVYRNIKTPHKNLYITGDREQEIRYVQEQSFSEFTIF